jgi:hypothetical protein
MWRPDYEDRHFCYFGILDGISLAIAALTATAPEAAAGVAAGAADAAITLPEVAVTATAPAAAAAGTGDVLAGLGAAGAGAGLAAGAGADTAAAGVADAGAGGGGVPDVVPTVLPPAPAVPLGPSASASTLPAQATGSLPAIPSAPAGVVGPPAVGAVPPPQGVPPATPTSIGGGTNLSDVLAGGGDSSATSLANATSQPGSFVGPTATGQVGAQGAVGPVGPPGAGGAAVGASPAGAPGTSLSNTLLAAPDQGLAATETGPTPLLQAQTDYLTANPTQGAIAPSAGTPAAGGNSFANFANKPSFENAFRIAENNPWLASAAAIAPAIIMSQRTLPGQPQTAATAAQLSAQGQQLQTYLQTGTLPPGVQQGIDQATQSAIAAVRSKYAAQGASGSSAEAEDIANIQQIAASQGAGIALQLLNTGVSETGMAAQIYQQITADALAQDQALGQALAGFGASMIPHTVTLVNPTPTAAPAA